MSVINLTNAQWTGQCQAVRCAAHFRGGSHHINVAHFFQSFFKFDQTIRVDSVVVCEQNSRHNKPLGHQLLSFELTILKIAAQGNCNRWTLSDWRERIPAVPGCKRWALLVRLVSWGSTHAAFLLVPLACQS